MDKMYVIEVVGERGLNSVYYVMNRVGKSAYGCTTSSIQYAYVGTKEKCQERLDKMSRRFIYLKTAMIRNISAGEFKILEDNRRYNDQVKKVFERRSTIEVDLSTDGTSVVVFFKKKPNKADLAMMNVFKKMGLTVRENRLGRKFVSVLTEG